MKRLLLCAVLLTSFLSEAHAFFFFFLPGSVTGKVSDALTGAEGDNCVSANAKIGDNIRISNGDVRPIKSLSGTSVRCTNAEFPIRALLGPALPSNLPLYESKAILPLPDGWESKPLNSEQKAAGAFLLAINKTTDTGLMLSGLSHKGITDMEAFVASRMSGQANRLGKAEESEIVKLTVNGVPAWRFSVTGLSKANALKYTYLATIFDAGDEIIYLSSWTTAWDFPKQKETLENIAGRVVGLTPPVSTAASPKQDSVTQPPNIPEAPKQLEPLAVTAPIVPVSENGSPTVVRHAPAVQRLRDLDSIFKDGVITREEFDAKKKEILKEM